MVMKRGLNLGRERHGTYLGFLDLNPCLAKRGRTSNLNSLHQQLKKVRKKKMERRIKASPEASNIENAWDR